MKNRSDVLYPHELVSWGYKVHRLGTLAYEPWLPARQAGGGDMKLLVG